MLYFLVIASLLAPAFALAPQNYARSHALLARQSSPLNPLFPAQCQSNCTAVVNLYNSCAAEPTCLCTNTNGEVMEACADCLVFAGNNPNGPDGQTIIDDFNNQCAGEDVTSISLSPHSTLASVPTGTATGTGTAIGTPTTTRTPTATTPAATSTSIGTGGSAGSTKSSAAIARKSLGGVLEIGVVSALMVLML